MSLCRWSSDDFRCDLYIYEAEGGWECHVASKRRVWEPPEGTTGLAMLAGRIPSDEWMDRYDRYHKALDAAPLEPVRSAWAGESFTGMSIRELAATVEMLADDGCRFPESVLDDVREMLAEETAAGEAGR